MGSKQTITRDEILQKAYDRACAEGISALDGRTRERTRDAEAACFRSIQASIQQVIEADDRILARARTRLDEGALAGFIWSSMLDSLRRGEASQAIVLYVLELALYGAQTPGA